MVDGGGGIVVGDQLLVVLARDVLRSHPGATIIADVKASQVLYDEIGRAGGQPLMFKTGHSLIKAKMAELGAPFAGYARPLSAVPDPVFADGMMGGGVAIDPLDATVRAPCAATVEAVAPTGHSVTLLLESR